MPGRAEPTGSCRELPGAPWVAGDASGSQSRGALQTSKLGPIRELLPAVCGVAGGAPGPGRSPVGLSSTGAPSRRVFPGRFPSTRGPRRVCQDPRGIRVTGYAMGLRVQKSTIGTS